MKKFKGTSKQIQDTGEWIQDKYKGVYTYIVKKIVGYHWKKWEKPVNKLRYTGKQIETYQWTNWGIPITGDHIFCMLKGEIEESKNMASRRNKCEIDIWPKKLKFSQESF